MTQDPYLKDVFPLPPLVAYKRQPNVKDKIIRAKVPDAVSKRPKREVPGMKKCLNCPICPFVKPGNTVKSSVNNYTVDINNSDVQEQEHDLLYFLQALLRTVHWGV